MKFENASKYGDKKYYEIEVVFDKGLVTLKGASLSVGTGMTTVINKDGEVVVILKTRTIKSMRKSKSNELRIVA